MADMKIPLVVRGTDYGKGVFARKAFKKNEPIFRFKGNILTQEELPTPYDQVDDHYVQIGKDLYMGPSGDLDDFFNHSCDPDSGLKFEGQDITLIAIRDINEGEEIVWDYSTTMDEDDWEMDCQCGSAKCRGCVRDFKRLPPETQQRYIELGIVPEYISLRCA